MADTIRTAPPLVVPLTIVDGVATWSTDGAHESERTLTLDADASLVILDAVAGAQGYLEVSQDDIGGRALTLPPGSVFGQARVHTDPRRKTALAWMFDGLVFRYMLAWEA